MTNAAMILTMAAAMLGGQPETTPSPAAPANPAPATPPAAPSPESAKPAPALQVLPQAVDPKVDEMLTRLETADQSLNSLTANMTFLKVFPPIQGGGEHVREGTLKFGRRIDAKGIKRRMFAVQFDSLLRDERLRKETKQYVFDGEVLIERDPAGKSFQRQRLVAPGSPVDPLRLGEGSVQFPMPLGQKKADMLLRFDVKIAPSLESVPKSSKMQQMLADAVQIQLVPKPGTPQARDYTEIRIWYRASDLLPLFAQSVNTDGSRAEVVLEDLKPNAAIAAEAFDTRAPDPKEGWQGKNDDAVRVERPQPAPKAP